MPVLQQDFQRHTQRSVKYIRWLRAFLLVGAPWKREIFTPVLALLPQPEPIGPGGRPGFHPHFRFKILVLQSVYGWADEQTQFQILDRRSFHRFRSITAADPVPDQNTIREFREQLVRAHLLDALFVAFRERLESKGFITRKGQIVDASFVEVPRQPNRKAENEAIKRGEVADGWKDDPKRLSYKDLDARWTKKNDVLIWCITCAAWSKSSG